MKLVCYVCGKPGVPQRGDNSFSVTLCNRHFNELHCSLQEKKPREALVNFHAARLSIRKADYIDQNEVLNDWMDKEHEYFLVTDGLVKGMKKHWSKKNKKPRPMLVCKECGIGIECTCREPML